MAQALGTFSGRSNHRLRLEVQQASQNIGGNYSTINWQLYIERTAASSSYYLSPGGSSSTTINGNVWNGGGFSYDFRSTAVYQLGSGSYNVGHAADGTKTLSYSASVNAPGTIGNASGSGSFVLTTIPRATTPTVSPTSGETAATFTIGHSPASSAFHHDVAYSLDGGATYVNTATNVPGTDLSTAWTPPHSHLPNDTSVTAIIRLSTRTSSGGAVIGTKTVNLPLTVPASIKPVVSSVTWVDSQVLSPDIPTLMGGADRFVQGWSKLKPTITSTGAGGSTVTSSSVTLNGQIAASGVAFSSAVALSGAVPFSATATDSRDRVSAAFANTVAVTAYNFPSLPTPLVTRTSDAAGSVPDPIGTYLAITPGASVSSLLFATVQKNLLEWQVRIRPGGGAFTTVQAWTALTVSGNTWTTKYVAAGPYASSSEWVVEVSIRDLFGKSGFNTASTVVSRSVVVPSEQVAFDWDGNNGFGVGKYRTQGMLDVFGPIYQNNGQPVIDPSNIETLLPERLRTTSRAVTGDWNSYVQTGFYRGSGLLNKPGADDWYYVTVVGHGSTYATQTATSYRTASNYAMFTRTLENGVWSPWRQLVTGTPFTNFTPTFLGASFVLGNATYRGWYNIAGGRCSVEVLLNFGSTTSSPNGLGLQLPVPASSVYTEIAGSQYNWGTARYLNTGVAGHPGGISYNPGSDATRVSFERFFVSGSELVTSGAGGSAPFAFAVGDDFAASFSYFVD